MINGGKVLNDIQSEHVTMAPGEILELIDRLVSPLAKSVGVTVGVKTRFEKRLDDVAKRMVDDAIAERRGADAPALRLVNGEMAVIARTI